MCADSDEVTNLHNSEFSRSARSGRSCSRFGDTGSVVVLERDDVNIVVLAYHDSETHTKVPSRPLH